MANRDNQRSRVYVWDTVIQQCLPKTLLTLTECENLIANSRLMYGRDVIEIIADGRGTRRASGNSQRINLPRWSRTRVVVLHEVAHSILYPAYAPHGPEFERVYLDLLARFIPEISRSTFRRLARENRVHISRSVHLPQPLSVSKTKAFMKIQTHIDKVKLNSRMEHQRHERRVVHINEQLMRLYTLKQNLIKQP